MQKVFGHYKKTIGENPQLFALQKEVKLLFFKNQLRFQEIIYRSIASSAFRFV